jgi:hypothetical protein
MSDPEAMESRTPPQGPPNDELTDNDMKTSEQSESFAADHNTLYATQPQPAPRRYSFPEPGRDTFDSQQAFLDSLKPIKIEDIEEDGRKCPICWKQYGDNPDPGYDNSERPVRLRCNHVYGEKCLADLFRLYETSMIKLRPLGFRPGDRGHLLGQMLYDHRRKLGAEHRDRNDFELFQGFLATAVHQKNLPSREPEDYWRYILQTIWTGLEDWAIVDITFMENVVVLDKHQLLSDALATPRHAISAQHSRMSAVVSWKRDPRLAGAVNPRCLSFPNPPAWKPGSCANYLASGVVDNESNYAASSRPPKGTPLSNEPLKTWAEALALSETRLDKLSVLRSQKLNKSMESRLMSKVQSKNQTIIQAVLGHQIPLNLISPEYFLTRRNGAYLLFLCHRHAGWPLMCNLLIISKQT